MNTDSLTLSQISLMTRDELVLLVVDFLQRLKEKTAILIKDSIMQDDLEKAREQIEVLNDKVDSLTKELNWSLKQNKYLENLKIPKLKNEVETRSSHRTQLLSEVKQYQIKVKDLQSSLKNLERESKLQVEKVEAEKWQIVSEINTYKVKAEKHQSQVKKLEFELSRKIDEIGIKNQEILREKDRYRLLEAKVNALEKQLKEAEKENKILEKKLPKTPLEEAIDRTKQEFKARADLSSSALTLEKKLTRTLKGRLTRKEQEMGKLKEQQADTSRLLAFQQQREALSAKKALEHTESDWKDLKTQIKALNYHIKELTENSKNDQFQLKEATDKVNKVTQLYTSEKMEHERLKESLKNKEDKVENEITFKRPTYVSKTEREANDKQVQPPIQKNKVQLPKTNLIGNRKILYLRDGKLEPAFKDDLKTQPKLKLKPTPPSKKKPEIPHFTPAGRKVCPTEKEQRKISGQPGGSADENDKTPLLDVRGKNIL